MTKGDANVLKMLRMLLRNIFFHASPQS